VEDEGRRALDVGCCTKHGSQHGRNMGHLGVVPRGGGRRSHDVGCCTQHARNITRWTFNPTAADLSNANTRDGRLSASSSVFIFQISSKDPATTRVSLVSLISMAKLGVGH
jgi:hypothetical protein